jgi:hypothetical protein
MKRGLEPMNQEQETEVQEILKVSAQIEERLTKLGFANEDDAIGNIAHHLAEVVVMAKKLADQSLPTFLKLPSSEKETLAELIVDLQYELVEMKEAIEDMEPALIKLMNFLNR